LIFLLICAIILDKILSLGGNMDAQQVLIILRQFREKWELGKGEGIWYETKGKIEVVGVCLEARDMQVIITVVKGPRGGITEEVFGVDPAKTPEVDQLVTGGISQAKEGSFVHLPDVRQAMRQKIPFKEAATAALKEVVTYATSESERFRIRLIHREAGEGIGTPSWMILTGRPGSKGK
jgi:hypothetical protein